MSCVGLDVCVCTLCELLNGLQAITAPFVYKLPGACSDWAKEISHTISTTIVAKLPFIQNEFLAVTGE